MVNHLIAITIGLKVDMGQSQIFGANTRILSRVIRQRKKKVLSPGIAILIAVILDVCVAIFFQA